MKAAYLIAFAVGALSKYSANPGPGLKLYTYYIT